MLGLTTAERLIFATMELGKRINVLLKLRGKTATEIAAESGTSPQHLGRIIRGLSAPTSEMVKRIAKSLDTTVAYLFGEIDDPSPDAIRKLAPEETNVHASRGDAGLLTIDEMELLERELAAIKRIREIKDEAFRTNTRSRKDDATGN